MLRQRAEPFTVRALAHLVFPAFRVLLEVPLLAGLANPRISYLPVQNGSGDEEAPTATSLLLPAEQGAAPSTGLSPLAADASKYGTFRTSRSAVTTASGPTTRTPTPAPSHTRVPRGKPSSKSAEKEEIALDPSWRELLQRFIRIVPYLWPSKSRSLQLLAVCALLCRTIYPANSSRRLFVLYLLSSAGLSTSSFLLLLPRSFVSSRRDPSPLSGRTCSPMSDCGSFSPLVGWLLCATYVLYFAHANLSLTLRTDLLGTSHAVLRPRDVDALFHPPS